MKIKIFGILQDIIIVDKVLHGPKYEKMLSHFKIIFSYIGCLIFPIETKRIHTFFSVQIWDLPCLFRLFWKLLSFFVKIN